MAKLKLWLQAKLKPSETTKPRYVWHRSKAQPQPASSQLQHLHAHDSTPPQKVFTTHARPVITTLQQPENIQTSPVAKVSKSSPPAAQQTPGAASIGPPAAINNESGTSFAPANPKPSLTSRIIPKKVRTDEEIAQHLIKQHDKSAQKALIWAVENKRDHAIAILLGNGIQDASPHGFHRCLSSALNEGNTALSASLISAFQSTHRESVSTALLDPQFLMLIATKLEKESLTTLLSDASAEIRDQIMWTAVYHSINPIIPPLLALGVDPNTCQHGYSILPTTVLSASPASQATLSTLLQHPRINPNALGYPGRLRTPRPALVHAASLNLIPLITILLTHPETRINTPDEEGNTALHAAAKNNHVNAIRFLLEKGADPVRKNRQGRQAVHIAGDEGNEAAFNVFRAQAGLPPWGQRGRRGNVRGGGVGGGGGGGNGGGGRGGGKQRRNNGNGGLWPDREVKDNRTGEISIIVPGEPCYWN